MSKKSRPSSIKEDKTASQLLQEFLFVNKMSLVMEIQDKGFVNVGDGFLMTDKPLLKMTPKFRK